MRIILSITLGITLLSSYVAYASSEADEDLAFADGFYAAVALGVNSAWADWGGSSAASYFVDDNFDALDIFAVSTPNGDTHDEAKIIGSVGLGYQWVGDLLYLGAQVSGTFSDTRSFHDADHQVSETVGLFPYIDILTRETQTFSTVTLGDSELDIDLKPGILLADNFLVYARGGVVFSELKITSSGKWSQTNDAIGGNPAFIDLEAMDTSSNNKNVVGFRVGAGVEYLMTEALGLSFDYIFTDYGHISTVTEAEVTGTPPSPSPPIANLNHIHGIYAPEISVTTHALMVGVVYHFE